MSNKRIGGDFNSLFDDNNMEESEGLRTLRLSEIEPNKGQPRKVFDKEAMEQLAESIRVNGVLQPLLVRPLSTGNYQIVAGEDAGEQLKSQDLRKFLLWFVMIYRTSRSCRWLLLRTSSVKTLIPLRKLRVTRNSSKNII